MENKFIKFNFDIGDTYDSPFLNKNGVYQDGTVPFSRDSKGNLWAISGHSHMGDICMFKGTTLLDMENVYKIKTNFNIANSTDAYNGIKYPEGINARGSIWPFGLYICPNTNRFFVLFHNETGWNAKGIAYDALGYCDSPKCDSDFRHIGLMHSDDEGRTWDFDRWVLTSNEVCFTEKFNPDNINVNGQKGDIIKLGSGDFSLFNFDSEYLYLFYNIIEIDINKWEWKGCNVYVARSRKREDGTFGDFVKYYDGSFSEAGNFGKETPIIINAWHPRVTYFKDYKCYLLSSSPINFGNSKQLVSDYMEIRTSTDLINWSKPIALIKNNKKFGNHYQAIISYHGENNPYIVDNNKFTILTCHNGTDVLSNDVEIK